MPMNNSMRWSDESRFCNLCSSPVVATVSFIRSRRTYFRNFLSKSFSYTRDSNVRSRPLKWKRSSLSFGTYIFFWFLQYWYSPSIREGSPFIHGPFIIGLHFTQHFDCLGIRVVLSFRSIVSEHALIILLPCRNIHSSQRFVLRVFIVRYRRLFNEVGCASNTTDLMNCIVKSVSCMRTGIRGR